MQRKKRFVFWGIISMCLFVCSYSNAVNAVSDESIYAKCLKELPRTLALPAKAPETMRLLVPKKDYLIDYESFIAGAGWGSSLKYRSTVCEVVVYAYNHHKTTLTEDDAREERDSFDGFQPESLFEKEVGEFIFYGTAGLSAFEPQGDKQVQMFSVAAVHNTFVKYRTVCRHITDISLDANYRMADEMTTQVIKETLLPLDRCLTQKKDN